MEALGDSLRRAREERKLSLDQVSQETNIALRYLQGFEEEDFSDFPGESYLQGFLRNYADYLGLDPDKVMSAYRAIKIQEAPVPVSELLHSKPPIKKIIIGCVAALALLSLGAGLTYYFLTKPETSEAEAGEAVHLPTAYPLEQDLLETRLYVGDSVFISLDTTIVAEELAQADVTSGAAIEERETLAFTLENIGETVRISTPDGPLNLDMSVPVSVVIDSYRTLEITAEDFVPNQQAVGVLMRFQVINTLPAALSSTGSSTVSPGTQVIYTSTTGTAYPITLQTSFTGYCMFRWEVLNEPDKAGRNEQYFQRGGQLAIQANNGVRIWASNAAAVSTQIIVANRTINQNLGGAGEVVVLDIRWIRDGANYSLIMSPLD
jgi:cytoskeletal protein RodZ